MTIRYRYEQNSISLRKKSISFGFPINYFPLAKISGESGPQGGVGRSLKQQPIFLLLLLLLLLASSALAALESCCVLIPLINHGQGEKFVR